MEKFKKGLTLLESIVAIFVLSIGILGAFSLITQTITLTHSSAQRLIAAHLAQEGIEIVRNIRDANFLQESVAWDEDLVGICPSPGPWCEADYDDFSVGVNDRYLQIDNDGYYNYGLGDQTPFKRKIWISQDSDEDGFPILTIRVGVEWQERGRDCTFEAQERLYEWLD